MIQTFIPYINTTDRHGCGSVGAELSGAQLQGANLWEAQLQAADLDHAQLQGTVFQKTQLQGVFSSKAVTRISILRFRHDRNTKRFKSVISNQVEKEAEMESVIFKGGMTEERLSAIEEKMNLDAAFWEMNNDMEECKKLKQLLKTLKKQHSETEVRGEDIPKINKYLESRRAVHGEYKQEEADGWIAEYKKAVGLEE